MRKVQQMWATIGKGLLAFPTLLNQYVDRKVAHKHNRLKKE